MLQAALPTIVIGSKLTKLIDGAGGAHVSAVSVTHFLKKSRMGDEMIR